MGTTRAMETKTCLLIVGVGLLLLSPAILRPMFGGEHQVSRHIQGHAARAPDAAYSPIRALATLDKSTTTVQLLDAVGRPEDVTITRDMLQLHQLAYCAKGLHKDGPAMSNATVAGNITLFGDPTQDHIIKQLRTRGVFEESLVQQMEWAIRQHPAGGLTRPLVVDAGTNVGVFTTRAAAAGARLVSFEAMPFNVQCLRRMLCTSPWLLDRVTLYGVGLGVQRDKCVIISPVSNPTDGKTLCGPTAAADLKRFEATGWAARDEMYVERMDQLVNEPVHLLKIDVEGSELLVLEGARSLLERGLVKYIIAEVNEGLLQEVGKSKLLRHLHGHRYSCSYDSFTGRVIPPADIESGAAGKLTGNNAILNVFCTLASPAPA